jgi:hypothetical protein
MSFASEVILSFDTLHYSGLLSLSNGGSPQKAKLKGSPAPN